MPQLLTTDKALSKSYCSTGNEETDRNQKKRSRYDRIHDLGDLTPKKRGYVALNLKVKV